ncbi:MULTISPECIES: LacI family DNA-binding transcriptional regulator [unclassified Meiothermus]|uniref:LacI family DNA-binding transcriptional regulator n=1 Tax=unclassified Meiothermus TaxID=370471 RepID=UPI000D7BCC42|nr:MULTISPECIES: LacI family DNA-binding transcriptional regulator [unclassified Meiothermus]PZA06316.1 LacI family transcriptional regulator [Meiothermus sp. Pnk-1]RYM30234.1 LacI family transcriptional regulator [Meiothermus sp. PNK-Is4]
MSEKRRVTQKDVALRAGVSQAIVSTVLTGREGKIRINEETRQRVLQAMRELGYVPNIAAQNLAGGMSRILGVFTYESVFPTSRKDFYYPFLEGIEEEAARAGFDLLLHTRTVGKGNRRSIYQGGSNRLLIADGTLLLGFMDTAHREELAQVIAEGHPCVFIGRREIPGGNLSYVSADYAAATRQLVEYLLELGHRKFVYLAEPNQQESALDRRLGYQQTGVGSVVVLEPAEFTLAQFKRLLRAEITAFVLENDRFARKLQSFVARLGLEVPRDLSYVVLGDPLGEESGVPEWTSFEIPRQEMGREAVRLLVSHLLGRIGFPKYVSLPCTLRPGNSTGPVLQRNQVR